MERGRERVRERERGRERVRVGGRGSYGEGKSENEILFSMQTDIASQLVILHRKCTTLYFGVPFIN